MYEDIWFLSPKNIQKEGTKETPNIAEVRKLKSIENRKIIESDNRNSSSISHNKCEHINDPINKKNSKIE